MNNLTFGITLIIVGMGGTLLTLALFSALMTILKRLFPAQEEAPPEKTT